LACRSAGEQKVTPAGLVSSDSGLAAPLEAKRRQTEPTRQPRNAVLDRGGYEGISNPDLIGMPCAGSTAAARCDDGVLTRLTGELPVYNSPLSKGIGLSGIDGACWLVGVSTRKRCTGGGPNCDTGKSKAPVSPCFTELGYSPCPASSPSKRFRCAELGDRVLLSSTIPATLSSLGESIGLLANLAKLIYF
jgi:hypothetical protein